VIDEVFKQSKWRYVRYDKRNPSSEKEDPAVPRTKKSKPAPTPQPEPPTPAANGPLGDVLTLAEAAAYLRLPEREVIAAAASQGLPGRLVGGEWRFLKTAIQQWLSVSQPTAEMRKAAILQLAGKWKDDPDAEWILEDAMRRRGRQPGPDGTYAGYRPAE
ncbi:MAG TPA: helix-turn-helix domain-containing protein, partial [Gemmataceae bacterium]|nr:helix-turn-helix domain-containing protein [Gemmataceae bacterium]